MMEEILDFLKTKQILYSQNVIQIREGIAMHYPDATIADRAKLFSSAIHKILERNLHSFDPHVQQLLKEKLLHHAIKKGMFDLHAFDIFETYIQLGLTTEDHISSLAAWLSSQCTSPISEDEAYHLLHYFKGEESSVPHTRTEAHEASHANEVQVVSTLPSLEPSSTMAFHKKRPLVMAIPVLLGIGIVMLSYAPKIFSQAQEPQTLAPVDPVALSSLEVPEPISKTNHLQPHLQYKEIDKQALNDWLVGRESLLAEEPYFSSMIDVAEEFHINPLLMFAITGQEQGFVKKTHPKATTIVNNPFNVFGSWQDFNTDIVDTSRIAARTILNLSEGCPPDADPIKWLNQKYAEDPNWHIGVSQILEMLEDIAG